MDELAFIDDPELRKTLEGSVSYIYALYEQSNDSSQSPLFQEETRRVIVLYVVSAIEAVLMYFYKVRREKIEYPEYRFVHSLPKQYIHNERRKGVVVVAVQENVEKKEHQIGLHDLVSYFKEKKLILLKTAEDILDLNEVRNTFHFSKPRSKLCDVDRVEFALKLLVYTLERAPRTLQKD